MEVWTEESGKKGVLEARSGKKENIGRKEGIEMKNKKKIEKSC